MRTTILFLLATLALACDPATDTGDAAAFCADLATQNEGCWTEELDKRCLEVYAECGKDLAVMESCPVQLACN